MHPAANGGPTIFVCVCVRQNMQCMASLVVSRPIDVRSSPAAARTDCLWRNTSPLHVPRRTWIQHRSVEPTERFTHQRKSPFLPDRTMA
mmetsp:Transcript_23710/g.58625  ORF Transcript_23710/g.58625 Transcript_23710/m.58625 type:complete len:89 (+) Transcript_23710:594-860(+)